MKFWGLLGMLGGAAAVDTYAAVAANACTNAAGCAGYYRAFAVSTTPPNSDFGPPSNVTGISLAAVGYQAAATQGGADAKLDVAGFRFKTPADQTNPNDNSLSFYWGYLGLNGVWNSATTTGTMAGAAAEVIAQLSSVNVYYDNDGVPGFQWNVNQADPTKRWNIFDCTSAKTNGYDCVDTNAQLKIATDLQWTPISHTKVLCSAAPGLTTGNYAAGCEIHSLTTVGSLSTAPAVPVLTFTIRIASQPVLINGVLHGPNFAKWDLVVNFPYSNYPNIINAATAQLAIVTVAAGRAGAFTGSAQRSSGSETVSFQAGGAGVRSYYAYNATATAGGLGTNVYTQVISGAEILAFSCAANSPCVLTATQALVNLVLQVAVTDVAAFGWKASIAIHSFGDVKQPASVEWDPTVGSGDSNSALLVIPSAFLLAVMAMFAM